MKLFQARPVTGSILLLLLLMPIPSAAVRAEDGDACPRWVRSDAQRAAVRDGLREGKLVVVLRHMTTDGEHRSTEDCLQPERTLGPVGNSEAGQIAAALGALEPAAGDVLHSQFCRAIETAELVFDPAKLGEPESRLNSGSGSAWLSEQVKAPRGGENLFLVTHSDILSDIEVGGRKVLKIPHDRELGIAAFFDPRLAGEAVLIGCLRPAEWSTLMAEAADTTETAPAPAAPGLSRETALEVCEPKGERAYLSRLRCADGSSPSYHRGGSVGFRNPVETEAEDEIAGRQMLEREPVAPGQLDYHMIDVYEVACPEKHYEIYLDMYHCEQPPPQVAPEGLALAP